MPVFKNGDDLNKYLEKQVFQWLTRLKKALPELLKEFIETEYYDQYTPKMYERQYRILNAIMSSEIKKSGNTYSLDVYLDPEKVSYDPALWGYPTHSGVIWSYKKGDDSITVFNNMANGIHGATEFGKTEGNFWETFLDAIDENGIYDIYEKFKSHIGEKSLIHF